MAEHFDIRLADMTSKRRPENIAFPRQIAMFLSRQMTESSLNTIGEAFGGRDHGTVLHACRLVKDRMEVDAQVRQAVHLPGKTTPQMIVQSNSLSSAGIFGTVVGANQVLWSKTHSPSSCSR